MSDDEVRKLERESESDPQACVRLARALERAGRPRDALAALVRGARDPTVRREAARYPRHVASIRQPPRVRWETRLDGRDQFGSLSANALGVVLGSKHRTVIVDPDSGAQRTQFLPGAKMQADEVLLIQRSNLELIGHDLWTGEGLHVSRVQGSAFATEAAAGWLASTRRREVVAYRLEDPRSAPVLIWRARVPGEAPVIETITRDVVVVADFGVVERTEQSALGHTERWGVTALIALDARDGGERFRVTGQRVVLADERGLIVQDQAHYSAVTPDGREAWRLDRRDLHLLGMDGERLQAVQHGEGAVFSLVAIDRRDGSLSVRGDFPPHTGSRCWLLGDVVIRIMEASTVDAVGLADGRPLWSWRPRGGSVKALDAIAGRLFVLCGSRSVVCLEESSDAEPPRGPTKG